MWHTALQLGHMAMVLVLDLTMALFFNPLTLLLVAVAAMPPIKRWLEGYIRQGMANGVFEPSAGEWLDPGSAARTASIEYLLAGCTFGAHAYAWLGVLVLLVAASGPCALWRALVRFGPRPRGGA
mmetsp:Transcript_44233/g.139404  ORF Transcript_44233/g.139404 Transcript_44233/m.139404 type:complete len:125 (-) Transcript_44233:587-961(-)